MWDAVDEGVAKIRSYHMPLLQDDFSHLSNRRGTTCFYMVIDNAPKVFYGGEVW